MLYSSISGLRDTDTHLYVKIRFRIVRGHYKMMAGVCLSVRLSVCRVPRPNWGIERPGKPKISRTELEAHHTGNR